MTSLHYAPSYLKKGTDLLRRDNNFFSFTTILYFWFEPNEDESQLVTNCVRILHIFLQLQSRKYLEDVETKLDITDLEEYCYDLLEGDDAAVDAKKPFHSVIGNCQNMAFAGALRTKVFCILFYLICFFYICKRAPVLLFYRLNRKQELLT